jgi:hypothetical protein
MCFQRQFFAQISERTARRANMDNVSPSTPDLPAMRGE